MPFSFSSLEMWSVVPWVCGMHVCMYVCMYVHMHASYVVSLHVILLVDLALAALLMPWWE
jgi:hypothetical protein